MWSSLLEPCLKRIFSIFYCICLSNQVSYTQNRHRIAFLGTFIFWSLCNKNRGRSSNAVLGIFGLIIIIILRPRPRLHSLHLSSIPYLAQLLKDFPQGSLCLVLFYLERLVFENGSLMMGASRGQTMTQVHLKHVHNARRTGHVSCILELILSVSLCI